MLIAETQNFLSYRDSNSQDVQQGLQRYAEALELVLYPS